MNRRGTVYALLLGNFITGSAVLAPAGMRQELAQHFGIGLGAAGLLMSLGAVVLCISSPRPSAPSPWCSTSATSRPRLRWRQAYFALALLGALRAVVLALGVPRRLATVALPSQN